jgi:hypothetical protein
MFEKRNGLEAVEFEVKRKTITKKYKSDTMASIHETDEALLKVDAIDKETMGHFDETCLIPLGPQNQSSESINGKG